MNLLNPLALLLALLAGPILLLYMLKLRRRQATVSSAMLWFRLMRDREANAPWQRIKRNLLLFLQLLILAALAFALARPFVPVPTVATGSVVVLLDASASMNASDGSPTRFDAAKAAARQLIEGLPAGERMTLIRVAGSPSVLAAGETDRVLLSRALDSAQGSDGPADWEAAFALAAGAVSAQSAERATVVVISDGNLPSQRLPPLAADVRFVPIGRAADNLAISALSLRPLGATPQLFARVTNHGDADRSVILSVYADDGLFNAEQITVPAGQSVGLILSDLPPDPTVYRAELASPASNGSGAPPDLLPTDDVAYAVYQPPAAGRTLLVSPGNIFLEQLLAAFPGLQPFRAPADAPLPADPFDLYVFDGVLPEPLPAQDLLLINPPPNALFQVGEEFQDPAGAAVAESLLTRHVEWKDVHILKARKVVPPDWAQVLVSAPGGPLVFAGEVAGRRIAVLTFDLHDSDLPLQVAFPILFSNLFAYLSPAQAFNAPDGLRPGDALTILPEADVDQVAVGFPDGTFRAFDVTESGVTLADTQQLGLYAINYLAAGTVQRTDYVAVNLFDAAESAIRPQPSITVGQATVAAASREGVGQREFWPWLAGAALLILLAEWWVYHRGSSISALPGARGWFKRPAGHVAEGR